MPEKVIDIEGLYSHELSKIKYVLINLEDGRFIELHCSRNDGSIVENIRELREEINKLLNVIQYGRTTSFDDMESIFK